MKNFHKNLNIAFVGGLLGAVLMTYIGPSLIGMLLTPPVSFGINCEPATIYAMKKLISLPSDWSGYWCGYNFLVKAKILFKKSR